MSLWDRRLIVITGKGGVGRSTLSTTIALAAGNAGRRVCVVELYGLGHIAHLFGKKRSYKPVTIHPGVDLVSLTPHDAVADFGRRKLRVGGLMSLLFRSRIIRGFIDGVPGLHDLVQLGKIEDMLNNPRLGDNVYDHVLLDAPATGHGLTMLSSARTMYDMTRVGPFADLAHMIEEFLDDREQTAFLLASLPEILPISETLQLISSIKADWNHLAAVLVNQVRPSPLPHPELWPALHQALIDSGDESLRQLATLGQAAIARHNQQNQVLTSFAVEATEIAGHALPVLHVPRIASGSPTPTDLDKLSGSLYEALSEVP
ncbi:MAG: hypothetical protein HN348_12365 [Proteobacteria bacterium]|nr:hypothetical protein [Pseudomonadota bacterium]